jgi:hypothetical protein
MVVHVEVLEAHVTNLGARDQTVSLVAFHIAGVRRYECLQSAVCRVSRLKRKFCGSPNP